MKKLKSILVFILILALCASLFTVASAKRNHHKDEDDNETASALSADIQTLIDLGLLVGSDNNGVTGAYAKSKPTRVQAFIVYLRLINAFQSFEQYFWRDGDDNFDDHHGHSPFVQKGMAFAKKHSEFNWIGSNGRFNPMAHLTAREYAKVLLAVLGYEYNKDFSWKTVESFAEGLGLNVPEGAFTFEVFALMTVQALNMTVKGSTAEKLIDRLGMSPVTDTTKPTVTDVVLSAPYFAGPPITSGTVTVYFSEAMKADTIKNMANYAVDLDGSAAAYTSAQLSLMAGAAAVPSADRKSVTLTIPGSALSGGVSAGAGVTDIAISGLKDAAENTMDTTATFVRKAATLTVTPTPAAVAANKLQVSFSNPMKTIDYTEFKLYKPDGVTPVSVGTGGTLDSTGKIATITLSVGLTADAKASALDTERVKLAIGTVNTKDIFDNTVSGGEAVSIVSTATPAIVTILDKIVPSVASLAKGTAPYTFEMTFTEPVSAADLAALSGALKIVNLSGSAQAATYAFSGSAGTIGSFTKLTATISGAYENRYAIELLGQGIRDASGNTVKAYAKTTLTVLTDNLPVITASQTQDLDTDGYLDAVKLTFSKNIKDSTVNAGHFDVIGYSAEAFNPATAGDTADNNIIYITFTESGIPDTFVTPAITYTQGTLQDSAGNMLASTGAVAAADKAAPAVITALPAGTITVTGTGAIGTLALSEDLTEANKTAVMSALQTHVNINVAGTSDQISLSYTWTSSRQLTVSITNYVSDGTNPDTIVLTAASADLFDALANKAAAAQLIK